jgi:hypothetical protein
MACLAYLASNASLASLACRPSLASLAESLIVLDIRRPDGWFGAE